MFVSSGQFYVFLACFSFGAASGILLSISSAIKYFVKNKIIKIILDAVFLAPIGILFSLYSLKLNFPSLRGYMTIAIFIGMLAYLKSFHIILAKCAKNIYNRIIEKKVNSKDGKTKVKLNRRKGKKTRRGRHGRGCFACGNSRDVTDLSSVVNDII